MTFAQFETSEESGVVLELYTFTQGGVVDRFTSFNQDIVWNGLSYSTVPISRPDTQNSIEDAINRLVLTMPIDNTIPQRFIASVPGRRISVTIQRAHAVDPDEESVILFRGFIANVSLDGELEAKVLCQPDTGILSREAPRFTYQALCNHVLYDQRCKVNQALFTFTGLVSGVSGNDVTINGLSGNGADWAVGGFTAAPAGGNDDQRMILSQAGDVVTLLLPFSIPVIGTNVDVFAGCFHDITTCRTKFDNVINYGGFAFGPRKNPFNVSLRGGS